MAESDEHRRVTTSHSLGGQMFGQYEIKGELGQGGQGYVWLAQDTKLGRLVALKILATRSAMSELARLRFLREAEICSKLEHPGICSVYEVGEHEGILFIAMPYFEGETFEQRFVRPKSSDSTKITFGDTEPQVDLEAKTVVDGDSGVDPFATTQVKSGEVKVESSADDAEAEDSKITAGEVKRRSLSIGEIRDVAAKVEEVARALHFAHEAGLIHRDVKPANIMVTRDERVVVLDFGLAYDDAQEGNTLTVTGDVFGTPAYMSPEQLSGLGRVDRRSDVYSLGATLFECISGQHPFQAATREALFNAVLTKDPIDLKSINPQIPDDLKVIVEAALEKDPQRRYGTALELAEDLRRFRKFEPIKARPPSGWIRIKRFSQRNPQSVLFIAFVILFLSAGMTMLWLKNSELAESQAAIKKEAEKNRQVQQFLTNMLRLAPPEEGEFALTVRELLDLAVENLKSSFADEPEVRATLFATIADSFEAMELTDRANEVRWTAIELLKSDPSRGDYWVAQFRLGIANAMCGSGSTLDVQKAIDFNSETIAFARKKLPEGDPLLEEIVTLSARLQVFMLANSEGKNVPDFLVDFIQQMHPEKPSKEHVRTKLQNYILETEILVSRGQLDEADKNLQELIDPFMKLPPFITRNIPGAINQFAARLEDQGQMLAAEGTLYSNVRIAVRVSKKDSEAEAMAYRQLASFYDRHKRSRDAEPLWREALRIDQVGIDANQSWAVNSFPKDQCSLALAMLNRGREMIRVGRDRDARNIITESMKFVVSNESEKAVSLKQEAKNLLADIERRLGN